MKHCPNPACEHLARHGRVAEFLDTAEQCTDCGELLLPGEAPTPSQTVYSYRELETVYETSDRVQAHLIRARLEDADISAHIAGEALQGAIGELPPTMPSLRVQVAVEDAARALSIVRVSDARVRGVGRPVEKP